MMRIDGTNNDRISKGDVVQFILHDGLKIAGVYAYSIRYREESAYVVTSHATTFGRPADKAPLVAVPKSLIFSARVLVRGTPRYGRT